MVAQLRLPVALVLFVLASVTPGLADPSGAGAVQPVPTIRFVTLAEVQAAVEAGTRILDANRPRTYARAHVPGAIGVGGGPLSKAHLPDDPEAPVVLYCATAQCPSSRMAAQQALALGHRNVQVYKDGLKGWLAAGLPTERAEAASPVATAH